MKFYTEEKFITFSHKTAYVDLLAILKYDDIKVFFNK